MKRFWVLGRVALSATFSANLVAERNLDDVERGTRSSTGPIHVIEGTGGNIGVLARAERIITVDSPFVLPAPRMECPLHDIRKGDVRFVANPHFHADHTGGNEDFGPLTPIIARGNERRRLQEQARTASPVTTMDGDVPLHQNSEDIHLT